MPCLRQQLVMYVYTTALAVGFVLRYFSTANAFCLTRHTTAKHDSNKNKKYSKSVCTCYTHVWRIIHIVVQYYHSSSTHHKQNKPLDERVGADTHNRRTRQMFMAGTGAGRWDELLWQRGASEALQVKSAKKRTLSERENITPSPPLAPNDHQHKQNKKGPGR